MGIDIYMRWKDQTEAEHKAQCTGFDTASGHVGYLREAYHGGPYATRLLVPEAFERDAGDEDGYVAIPAALLRERLTTPCEVGPRGGHAFGELVAQTLINATRFAGGTVDPPVKPDNLHSMTVEEAVLIRAQTLYNEPPESDGAQESLKSFRDFVALAERKEAELGEPVQIMASY